MIHTYDLSESDFYYDQSVAIEEDTPIQDSSITEVEEKPATKQETTEAKTEKAEDDIFGDDDDDSFSYVEEEDEGDKKEEKEEKISDRDLDDFFNSDDDRYSQKPKNSDSDTSATSDEQLSKYDKIKAKKQEEETKSPSNKDFYKYAFYQYFTEDAFIKAFEKAEEEAPKKLSYEEKREQEEEEYKKQRMIEKRGTSLGINKLAVIEPSYYVIEDGQNDAYVNHVQSNIKKQDLEESLNDVAKKIDLDLTILNPKTLSDDDIETFNAIMKLKEWLNEVENHSIESPLTMISTELDGTSQTLGTRYIALPQVYNVKIYQSKVPYVWSMLYVVTIPWAISKMASEGSGYLLQLFGGGH